MLRAKVSAIDLPRFLIRSKACSFFWLLNRLGPEAGFESLKDRKIPSGLNDQPPYNKAAK